MVYLLIKYEDKIVFKRKTTKNLTKFRLYFTI